MTEAQWLASKNPQDMLTTLTQAGGVACPSNRKFRLLACAVVRLFWPELTEPMREVIRVAERMADGLAGDQDFYAASRAIHEGQERSGDGALRVLIHKCAVNLSWNGPFVAKGAVGHALYLKPELAASIADLLRCVAGNPWRPIRFRAEKGSGYTPYERWATPLVLSLANAAYDERQDGKCEECLGWGFIRDNVPYGDRSRCEACYGSGYVGLAGSLDPARLAVLADAIEEAGLVGDVCPECKGIGTFKQDHPWGNTWVAETLTCHACEGACRMPHPLLNHLRISGPHVAGCWATDAIRGVE